MKDYYKNQNEYDGIAFEINYNKRDYYNPVEKQRKNNEILNSKPLEKNKDYKKMIELQGEKFYKEYTSYPFFKRKAIIKKINDKEILRRLFDVEKNEKIKNLISFKIA